MEGTETPAPQSTMEIAQSVVEQSESHDSSTESTSTAEQPRVLAEHATAPETKPEPELTASQKFLVGQGHKWGKRPDGKTDLSFLPASTVANMLEKFADERRELWSAEHHAPTVKERDQLKADLEEFVSAMRGDPKAFIETVAQHDPRYRSFLTPQEKVEIAADANDPEPALVLDKGAEEYTKSLAELRKWDRRQAKREAVAATKAIVEPLQRQAQLEQFSASDREVARTIMADAQTWEGFGALPADGSLTEHQAEVLKVLSEDSASAGKSGRRLMTIKEAHLQVLSRRQAEQLKTLAANDAERRAAYAKEQNEAPRSTSISRTGADAVSAPKGKRTTEDIAREVIARSEA